MGIKPLALTAAIRRMSRLSIPMARTITTTATSIRTARARDSA
nr:MAG TPA: hypothetical protein [Bacteriophage sp.]